MVHFRPYAQSLEANELVYSQFLLKLPLLWTHGHFYIHKSVYILISFRGYKQPFGEQNSYTYSKSVKILSI